MIPAAMIQTLISFLYPLSHILTLSTFVTHDDVS
jgi:hypothetical protein